MIDMFPCCFDVQGIVSIGKKKAIRKTNGFFAGPETMLAPGNSTKDAATDIIKI